MGPSERLQICHAVLGRYHSGKKAVGRRCASMRFPKLKKESRSNHNNRTNLDTESMQTIFERYRKMAYHFQMRFCFRLPNRTTTGLSDRRQPMRREMSLPVAVPFLVD